MCIRDRTNDDYYSNILKTSLEADLIFLSSFIRVKAYQGSVSLSNKHEEFIRKILKIKVPTCLLYTSDAADERSSVDLGGRRIIKKKTQVHKAARDIQSKNTEERQHTTRIIYPLKRQPTD